MWQRYKSCSKWGAVLGTFDEVLLTSLHQGSSHFANLPAFARTFHTFPGTTAAWLCLTRSQPLENIIYTDFFDIIILYLCLLVLRRFQFPGRCLGGGARYLGTLLSHDVMRLKVAGPLQELSLNVHTPQQLRTTTKVMLSPQTLLSSLNFGVAFHTNTDHHSQICLPKLLAAPRSCKRAPSRSEYFAGSC